MTGDWMMVHLLAHEELPQSLAAGPFPCPVRHPPSAGPLIDSPAAGVRSLAQVVGC